jgi:hypothetical protein
MELGSNTQGLTQDKGGEHSAAPRSTLPSSPAPPESLPRCCHTSANPRSKAQGPPPAPVQAHLPQRLEGTGLDRFWREPGETFGLLLHPEKPEQIWGGDLDVQALFVQGQAHLVDGGFSRPGAGGG